MMKIILLMITLLFFVSCGSDSNEKADDENKDDTVVVDEEQADNTEEIADDAEVVDEIDDTEENADEDDTGDLENVDEEDPDEDVVEETPIVEGLTVEDLIERAEGKYAHYDIVAYQSDMDLGTEITFKNLIISYGFSEFKKNEDGKLVITDRFCHSEQISNQSDFVSIVPDSLTQAIIPDSIEIEVKVDDDGNPYLWRPETPTLLGIEYPDPYNTPLPETIEPDDERLVDADNDGKPGVTVFMAMFGNTEDLEEIQIARREIFKFAAYLKVDGNLEGVVHDRSEQLVIDASLDYLKIQQNWTQNEDLSLSPIILVPVDDSYDCEKLMEERDNLFPPNPPVWED